jgi:polyisoprenoid-binding protein YceI
MTKNIKWLKNILLIAIATQLISAVNPKDDIYTLSKDYSVTINGTSNLHNWNESVGTVTGSGTVNWNSDGSFNLEVISIKMEVLSIKSDVGGAMNNNTYKALKADANPEIIFTLSIPVKSIKTDSAANTISASGNMTIAGVTKPVVMQVKAFMPQKGVMEFEGSQIIMMSDYGVKPPTALLGMLKTGNAITITFKTNFSLSN